MKLLRNGPDFLILDDSNKVIQVVRSEESGDAQKLLKEQKTEKYRNKIKALGNKKLIEFFVELIYTMAYEQEKNNPDFEIILDCVYNEIDFRMSCDSSNKLK